MNYCNGESEGKEDELLIFADAACGLSKNQQFEECQILERWWEETHREWLAKNLKITLICPHAKAAFLKNKLQNALPSIRILAHQIHRIGKRVSNVFIRS